VLTVTEGIDVGKLADRQRQHGAYADGDQKEVEGSG